MEIHRSSISKFMDALVGEQSGDVEGDCEDGGRVGKDVFCQEVLDEMELLLVGSEVGQGNWHCGGDCGEYLAVCTVDVFFEKIFDEVLHCFYNVDYFSYL